MLYVSQCWVAVLDVWFQDQTIVVGSPQLHPSVLLNTLLRPEHSYCSAAAGVITSIAVTRSLDDAMISCVYRRPPLMHMAIGYRCLPKIIELDF